MPARALRRALALTLVVGGLLVFSPWSVRDQDARGEEQARSGIRQGQAHFANGYWTDPTLMYEACAMGSSCCGCQQLFWNTVVWR